MADMIKEFAETYLTLEHDIHDISIVIKKIRLLSPHILLENKNIVSFAILVATLKINHKLTIPIPG
jgi:hypothetical protein